MVQGTQVLSLAIMLSIAVALPGQAQDLPSVTAQFFATAVYHDAWRDEPGRQVEIAQSAHWRRETFRTEEGLSNNYTDSQSGAAITWYRAHDDSREVLSAHVERPGSAYQSVSYAMTDRSDHLLGERCTVWEGEFRNTGMPRQRSYETCVTSDGLILWQRFHHRDGAVREVFRLTSLDRRTVRADEIMPPRRIFQPETWRDAAPRTPSEDDLEIELVSSPNDERQPEPDTETVRAGGGWIYTHTVDGDRSNAWRIEAPTLRLHYTEADENSGGRRLMLWRAPADFFERSEYAGPIEPPREDEILGRRCQWFNTMIVSHRSLTACRTDDGLVLARREVCDGARGGVCHFDVRATAISRGPLAESAMALPAQAFNWPSR
jgi:hypothetical protein